MYKSLNANNQSHQQDLTNFERLKNADISTAIQTPSIVKRNQEPWNQSTPKESTCTLLARLEVPPPEAEENHKRVQLMAIMQIQLK